MTRLLVTTHGPKGFDEAATAEARDEYRVHARRLSPAGHRIVCWHLKRDDVRASEVAAALGATRGEAFAYPAGVVAFESHVPGLDLPVVLHRFVEPPPERPPGERPDFDASGTNISFEAFGFTVTFARALDDDEARFVDDVFSYWIAAYSSYETQGYRNCGSGARAGDTSASFWFDRCTVQTGAHRLVGHARHVVHVLARFLPVTKARFDEGKNAEEMEARIGRPLLTVGNENTRTWARLGLLRPDLTALAYALVPVLATRWVVGAESVVYVAVRVLCVAALLFATRRRLARWLSALGVASGVGVIVGNMVLADYVDSHAAAVATGFLVSALRHADGFFVLAWITKAAIAWVREA